MPVYLSPLARSCHHSGNAVPSVWQGRAIVVAQYCRYDGKGTGYIVYVSSRYFCVCYIIMYPISVAVKVQKKVVIKFGPCYNKKYTLHPAERERRFRNDENVEVSLGGDEGWLGQAIISNRPEIGERKT